MGLLKVTKNGKTGMFEVSHGHEGDEEEASLNRIWRVVGNRNDQMEQQVAQEEYYVSAILFKI